jgi:hypothetical protein
MELDDLKSIWKDSRFVGEVRDKNIGGMLHGTSRSIISKLKRNLWMELSLTFVVGLIVVYFLLTLEDGALKWSFLSLLVLSVAYVAFFAKKIIQLNNFDPTRGNIRENLENLIIALETYVRYYRISYAILYPFYFILILFFLALDLGYSNFIERFSRPQVTFKIVGLAVMLIGLFLFISKWFLGKMYGTHINKLKILLKDLQM